MSAPPSRCRASLIPVTIITGFLGAGKTTLLNHLLKQREEKSIGVIENEFGAVNIDRELVVENLVEQEDLVGLSSGCVCCSLRQDVVRALSVLDERSRTSEKKLDAIVLETTGLADPAPLAFTFFSNPWVQSRFQLDSIVCVVDAKHLLQHIEQPTPDDTVNEAAQQLAFADLILINKIDSVTPDEVKDVTAAVRLINASAPILHTTLTDGAQCPPLKSILSSNRFSLDKALLVDPRLLDSDSGSDADDHPQGQPSCDSCTAPGERQLQSSASSARPGVKRRASQELMKERQPRRRTKRLHDLSSVSSVAITAPGPLDEWRFNMFIRDLLMEKSKDIFRCKGVLAVQGYGDSKFVFQGVHDTLTYGPVESRWEPGTPRISKIVFIGRGLNKQALLDSFRSCVWIPLPDGWNEFKDKFTGQPYYFHCASQTKTWTRPMYASAHVTATIIQPSQRVHKRAVSRAELLPCSAPMVVAVGAGITAKL